VRLLKVEKPAAREFYEAEALRCGWTVRQLDRQIGTLFCERTLASRNRAAMLGKGGVAQAGEEVSAEEEIKDPLVLEFLGLKDEYSETELEEALIRQLEHFLLELGGRLRICRPSAQAARIVRPVKQNDFHRACPGGITTGQLPKLSPSLFLHSGISRTPRKRRAADAGKREWQR
jgi:predicted nuclease of restriction endonuclease-like (RecB) superfamily